MKPAKTGWSPEIWASLKPFGIGEQRPNNYLEIWRALQENRDALGYAWRILDQGVCDGCALGTDGLRDWTLAGPHLCNIRLRLLRLNTMAALNPTLLADVAALERKSSAELRELGRLPEPMLRRRGQAGFRTIGWDAALDIVAEHIRASSPERLGFYLTSRGMPNESYYAAQKAVRAMGSNSIDNAARLCHSPSTVALKGGLGVAATTCSYSDWLEADLIVFFGSNVANNQPVATKYLHYARKRGTRVAMVNSYREPGMERYWIPSIPESALFGTRLTDRFFMINVGGDIAFINGVIRAMIAAGTLDWDFIREYTSGFQDLLVALGSQSWQQLETLSGADRDEMRALADMIGRAEKAVFVWSMGVTQHSNGEDGVRAIINLALTRGFVGRAGCGVMPIRGHSGVQGGAEMGAYATVFPGGLPIDAASAERLARLWGFAVPVTPGLITPQMLDAAHAGELDVLFAAGGNFRETMPDPDYVAAALMRVPLRVHMDLVVSSQMLLDPADTVLLLPAATRYEIPGGVTETSTERRVIFSPEIKGPRIGSARPEWQVFMDLARRVRPELADKLHFATTAAIREEIARVIPIYDGIQHLKQQGDQFQYGGPHLCADWDFPLPGGRARFVAVQPATDHLPSGRFRLTTRRGKQFNSIVHEQRDMLNGAARDDILLSPADARRLGIANGDAIVLRNEHGEFSGRARIAPVTPGNLHVHWPEANVLLSRERRSVQAGIPDYNTYVEMNVDKK